MRRLINQKVERGPALFLALLPFALVIAVYAFGSAERLAVNPNDKLLPGWTSFVDAIDRMAFQPDKRTGNYLLWTDTYASLVRLFAGVASATLFSLIFGICIGILPIMRATFAPFIAVIAMIPPLAVLPILFIVFGLGETAKIVLIAIGVAPFITRDIALRVEEIPREQIVKAETLGANSWQIITRVVLPQIWPRLIDSVRLSLGAAWLFLISAEAIASQSGLGYRIFLLRRFLAMDVILPYVAWITLLAVIIDAALRLFQKRAFPWFAGGRS
ncbi:ABC transporter permease [Methyloligella sp. 2.7D]|uniref:ABC transporter permease n=1 Tax=unclassified Methyloligella TaxID=2625955 RepID=UPI00157D5D71|nr:ABC transporter permease [Methyloligella sp. GL2]QKP76909.1 ABC transporter permease [Methyloligella sp. GL2]